MILIIRYLQEMYIFNYRIIIQLLSDNNYALMLYNEN